MADKIKAIKIKQQNGTYTGEIPISVNVQNVQWDENNHTLLDALGSVDISSSGKGNLQHQIDELDGDKISTNEFNSRLNDFLKDQISADTTDWLDDNVNPVGSAVIVDKTLTIEGAAADAKVVKTELDKKANASNTYTKAEVNAAIDAKQIEVDDTLSITGTAADAKAVGDELAAVKADLSTLADVTPIPDNSDLNDYVNTGLYTIEYNNYTILHYPTDTISGSYLEVVALTVGYIIQKLTKANDGSVFVRRRYDNGTWTDWIQNARDVNAEQIFTESFKQALLNVLKHVVYTDGGNIYYKALYELFYNGGDYKALYEMLDKYINNAEVDTGVALSKANFEYTIVIDATDTHIFTDMVNDVQRVLLSGIAALPKETGGSYWVGPKVFVKNTGSNSKTYFINNSGVSHSFATDNGKHSICAIIKCNNVKTTNMLWVDGTKVFENTSAIYDLHHANTAVIGAEPGYERFWNGNVFRLSIYDYLLSDEEINTFTSGITDKSQLLRIEKTYYSNRRTATDIQTNVRTQDLTIIVKATHESPYNSDVSTQYNLLSSITKADGQSKFMGVKLYVNTQNGSKTVSINCMGVLLETQVENTNCNIFGILRFKTDSNGNNYNSYVYLDANGTKKEQSAASNGYYNHNKYLMIGDDVIGNNSDDNPNKQKWTGYVEVEVYNRALSDSEIQAVKEEVDANGSV